VEKDEKGRFIKGHKKIGGIKKGDKHFDFNAMFEEAVSEMVKSGKINIKDPEKELMMKGIIEALKGNHNFWKSIAEWRYGKPKESIDISVKPKMVQLDD